MLAKLGTYLIKEYPSDKTCPKCKALMLLISLKNDNTDDHYYACPECFYQRY